MYKRYRNATQNTASFSVSFAHLRLRSLTVVTFAFHSKLFIITAALHLMYFSFSDTPLSLIFYILCVIRTIMYISELSRFQYEFQTKLFNKKIYILKEAECKENRVLDNKIHCSYSCNKNKLSWGKKSKLKPWPRRLTLKRVPFTVVRWTLYNITFHFLQAFRKNIVILFILETSESQELLSTIYIFFHNFVLSFKNGNKQDKQLAST